MLRTIIWFVYFWLYQLMLYPTLLKVNRLEKEGKKEEHDLLVHKIVTKWAKSLVNLTGSKIVVKGLENLPAEGSFVFVSNHQGNFDIPILLSFIDKPKAFIAKIEILKMPLVRSWMKNMKCVFMDRSDIRQSLNTINTAASYIKEGYSMVIFPEGTRSKGPTLGSFKPGSLKLAMKAGVPVIPITIKGSYKIMEQNKFGFIMKPANVEVIISEPIPTADLLKEESKELPEKIKEVIAGKLN